MTPGTSLMMCPGISRDVCNNNESIFFITSHTDCNKYYNNMEFKKSIIIQQFPLERPLFYDIDIWFHCPYHLQKILNPCSQWYNMAQCPPWLKNSQLCLTLNNIYHSEFYFSLLLFTIAVLLFSLDRHANYVLSEITGIVEGWKTGFTITGERTFTRGARVSGGGSPFLTESKMMGTTGNVAQDWGSALMCRQKIRDLLMVNTARPTSSSLSTLVNSLHTWDSDCCVTLSVRAVYNTDRAADPHRTQAQYKSPIVQISKQVLSLNISCLSKNGHCEEHESLPLICIRSEFALIVFSLVFVNITKAATPL